MLGRHRKTGSSGGGGASSAGAGDAAPVAAPTSSYDADLPVRSLVHSPQKDPMSCSAATVKSAGEAFGRSMGSEKAIRKKAERGKGSGTYDVGRKGAGIPFHELAHSEGMGAYRSPSTKEDLRKIAEAGHIPVIITSVGGGRHIMPARPGTPHGRPGEVQLFDPMAKAPAFKKDKDVFERAFQSGRNSDHRLHSLYGIAPTRGGRSASMSSLDSSDEGLTPGDKRK